MSTNSSRELVLVVDYGAQYAQLIARRIREAHVYSEIVPYTISAADLLARKPSAIILSGGPSSIYAKNAPKLDSAILDSKIPILGICYGFQAMADALGGTVKRTDQAEFGRTKANLITDSVLFSDLPSQQTVWMSHRDAVVLAPEGFKTIASTNLIDIAALENSNARLYGVQWHPEVIHSEFGQHLLERFLYQCCELKPRWTAANIIDEAIKSIRQKVGKEKVLCGLSGGVDSAVTAALMHKAVGEQSTCVFVDHGLLREGERKQVINDYALATGIEPILIDARNEFLQALTGISDPETKRKIIGHAFIEAFEMGAAKITAADDGHGDSIEYLAQGTLYPDIVESGNAGAATLIKSHHNVGGLPENLKFKLIEPLSFLFKDEVRMVGLELGLPESIVWRHPFPGPGLAIRIIGKVTKKRLTILRKADAITNEELTKANLERSVWQFPVILLANVKSVGVQGDQRTYGYPIVLRPINSEDVMSAVWSRLPFDVLDTISTRIVNEIKEINRVVLDITNKPPATIEWE